MFKYGAGGVDFTSLDEFRGFDLGENTLPLDDNADGQAQKDIAAENEEAEHGKGVEGTHDRKKRGPRQKNNIDPSIELRSADLAGWRDNYIENMEEQVSKRKALKQTHNSKLMASKIVLEWGIGGELRNPELNSLFSGRGLIETFKKAKVDIKGKKRARERSVCEDDRRVKARGEHESYAGDLDFGYGNDGENYLPANDYYVRISPQL